MKAMAVMLMWSSQERMVWLLTLTSLLSTSFILHPGLLSLIALVMSTSESTCKSLETSANFVVELAVVSSVCTLADAAQSLFGFVC